MKDICIWYFETGWIISTILSIVIGAWCGRKNKLRPLLYWIAFVLLFGVFAFYYKNNY